VLSAASKPRSADVAPGRIVAALADEGAYLANGVQLRSCAARQWPERPSRSCQDAQGRAPAHHARRPRAARRLVLGSELPACQRVGRWFPYLTWICKPQDRRLGLHKGLCKEMQKPPRGGLRPDAKPVYFIAPEALGHGAGARDWLGVMPPYSRLA
jgi:hypothetical protein